MAHDCNCTLRWLESLEDFLSHGCLGDEHGLLQHHHHSNKQRLSQRAGWQRLSAAMLQLRVAPSQSKHKLYIGNIPKDLNKETFKEQLDAVVKGAHVHMGTI